MPGLAIYTVSFLLITVILKKLFSRRSEPTYPPGPPGRVFIGNLREIPTKKPWLAYTEWAKNYGDIMYLKAMDDHIVILSSIDATNDLLTKRSRIYSGRPHEDIAITVGWDFNTGLQNYSDVWRRNRRLYQQIFRPDAIVQLRPAIQECIGTFMQNLVESPEKFMDHIALLSAGMALKTMYGITIKSGDDPLVATAKSAAGTADKIFAPSFVAILRCCPFIMSVPRWVPVLGHARQYIEYSQNLLDDLREMPLQQVRKNMESDVGNNGVALRLLRETNPGNFEQIRRIKDVATVVYFAGVDTTASSTGTFFLAMAKNVQVQRKAQLELDAVVGRGRLPTLDDRGNLPYIEAIYREVMRWYPAVPLGVPHMATEPDNYKEYYIPQGTLVFSNIWAMTHDEDTYPNPYEFKPERFMDTNGNINDVLAYGFGRRICVGRHLADAILWLTFASVLACFNIEKEKDEQGNEIDIPEHYSDGPGFFSHPLPFRCSITPRHAGVEK